MSKRYYFPLKHDVIRDQLLSMKGSTIKVYLALAIFADFNSGLCWPSRRKLKEMTGLTSGRQIREHLEILVEAGLIDMWKVKGRMEYQLL